MYMYNNNTKGWSKSKLHIIQLILNKTGLIIEISVFIFKMTVTGPIYQTLTRPKSETRFIDIIKHV